MSDANIDETLISIVRQYPARVLESYYWSEEEGVLEFIRSFLRLPMETQTALKTLLQASPDPRAIHAAFDEQGQLILRADRARTMGLMIGTREAASQTPARPPCAIG